MAFPDDPPGEKPGYNPFCQRLRALGIFQDPICKKFPFRRLKRLFENEGRKANGVCIALSLPLGGNDKVVMHGILMHPCPEASARRITFLRTRGKFRVTHGGRRGKSGGIHGRCSQQPV